MTNEGRDASRAMRLTQIQSFLSKSSRGLTTSELAQMCSVTVRTIQRDLTILQTEMGFPIEYKGHDRWGVIKDHAVSPAVFSLNETVVIFLALRLMIRQTDEGNPYNRSAISKLISMMPKPLAAQLNRSNARA